jgi:hypothetical protein
MGSQVEPAETVLARAREALATDPRVGELELDLRVAGGRLVVGGGISTEERRDRVTEVLRERFPDLEVVNRINVVGADPPGEEDVE